MSRKAVKEISPLVLYVLNVKNNLKSTVQVTSIVEFFAKIYQSSLLCHTKDGR